jgi:N-glycosylase/DNA lyase
MHQLSLDKQPFSLDLNLQSGQSFAWRREDEFWIGSIRHATFVIRQFNERLEYVCSIPNSTAAGILNKYFSLDEDQSKMIGQFPDHTLLRTAVASCPGLRILRQDPWECLAGFILSSTKQIIHIQQIWQKMSLRWGTSTQISLGDKKVPVSTFPTAQKISELTEQDLRTCGMGFRAAYLLGAAREVSSGSLDLEVLKYASTSEARERLMQLHGVGPKIADCVLLFSLGKMEAFPVDTWILKVLRRGYFPKRKVSPEKLKSFAIKHFGPYGGYAQQFLFHYARTNPSLFQ